LLLLVSACRYSSQVCLLLLVSVCRYSSTTTLHIPTTVRGDLVRSELVHAMARRGRLRRVCSNIVSSYTCYTFHSTRGANSRSVPHISLNPRGKQQISTTHFTQPAGRAGGSPSASVACGHVQGGAQGDSVKRVVVVVGCYYIHPKAHFV